MCRIASDFNNFSNRKMKKIFLILVFSTLAFLKNTRAQSPVTDTLAYLQTIVANKSFFIGKPFSVLQDSLKIQIKFFSPFGSIPHDKRKETSTSFSFYFPLTPDDMWLTYPKLRISWSPYLNADQSDLLYGQNNGGGWSPNVASFYATGIIADIRIRE